MSRDLRSLHCVNYLDEVRLEAGGVTRAVLDLCSVLAKLGHRVSLVTFDATDVPVSWQQATTGVPEVVQLEASRWGRFLKRQGAVAARTLVGDADVIHLHALWEPANRQLARIAREVGTPYVQTPHGQLDDWSMRRSRVRKRIFLRLGGRSFLERAARIHCTAVAEQQQAGKWFPHGQSVVLPYVFDLEPFGALPGPVLARQRFGLRTDVPRILFLSRLHPKKGVELLVEAAAILQRRGHGLSVLLAGPVEPSYLRRLQQRVREHGLGETVQFLGMIQGELKLSLYEASDVLVLPTSQENFGFVLAEAMACGTAVITTRGVDIWCELERGGATIVERRATAIADAIQRQIEHPEEFRTHGRERRQFIFDWLDPEKVGRCYETMYRQILSELV